MSTPITFLLRSSIKEKQLWLLLRAHYYCHPKVVNGPILVLRLRAHVTMPDMEVSDDVLEFGEVKCGECKVVTVQLHNHQKVKCEWDSTPVDNSKQVQSLFLTLIALMVLAF